MLGQLSGVAASTAPGQVARGGLTLSNKFITAASRQQQTLSQARTPNGRLTLSTSPFTDSDVARHFQSSNRRAQTPLDLQILQAFPEGNGSLPDALYRLLDPAASVELPPPGSARLTPADNRELDKLVAALGRNKATWRRALLLHDWLLQQGHRADDRLCTTLIRVCAQHGQAATALSLYDWMRAPVAEGGAGLSCTVFTYTAAMRAALTGNMPDRAMQVWEDAVADKCDVDCRLCTTLIEVCARRGDTQRALQMYRHMRAAPADSKLAPTVHAYTAAMRAAAEGGLWEDALAIWDDMETAGCKPTGHAYAAVISACASGGQWQRAVALFDEMLSWGIKPDVVSCTALITALGTEGQWERAEKVVEWMLRSDIKPNVRTYTALIAALGNAGQWERALEVVQRMRRHAYGSGVEPNAYTYSALLKTMGEHGKWQLAEAVFTDLEKEQVSLMVREAQLAAAQQLTAGLVPGGGAPAVQQHYASDSSSSSGPGGAEAVELSAFPGMRRTVALDLPAASAATSSTAASAVPSSTASSPQSAIAAAAAAVAAVAAAQQRAAAGGVLGLEGSSLVSQLLLQSAAAAAASAQEQAVVSSSSSEHSPTADASSSSSTFSYFSGLGSQQEAAAGAQVSPSGSETDSPTFCLYAHPPAVSSTPTSSGSSAAWTNDNAAIRGLPSSLLSNMSAVLGPSGARQVLASADTEAAAAGTSLHLRPLPKGRGPVNEVVCGALMLAYERAGKWEECAAVLDRARALGISPSTIMYNTALSALGKALQVDQAEALFREVPGPDAVTFETLIAAYGMTGQADKAERTFAGMAAAGFAPRDYAYCGLVAAHSFKGDLRAALRVRDRMQAARVPLTVHVYNALIAACDRAQAWDKALELHREMKAEGVAPNTVTQQLLEGVCQGGVRAVEKQQAAAAALSAAVAAAGSLMMRAGVF